MSKKYSFIACILISLVVVSYRFAPVRYQKNSPLIVTTWDALGYYLYLPSIFIYHDFKELRWFPEIDHKYSVSGGTTYQFTHAPNGKIVFKYLGGVAIMELPFFLTGHLIANLFGYTQDGFSPPYQFSIALGAIIYFILALFLLRKILLKYFDEYVTALSLIFMMLASNIIQYISIDGAMSHSYIFPLYVLVLCFTIKWHVKPTAVRASIIGAIIGLAMISRPTEAVMLFIPLLWGTQSKISSMEKWKLVRQNKIHLFYGISAGFLAVLPQLVYWKLATGSFVYDVGSKWEFLSPHFRVLFGWENGWFIYTPITVFFILGMFFIKNFPFRYSVITFCLLNIYIIIAWHDWRYGASYSCRALTQSYPVFVLPFAAFIRKINTRKWRYLFYVLGIYSIFVNLFQIWQYNKTILHYRDMNRKYYCSIYLNPNPSPLDMSLLDTDEMLHHEDRYQKKVIFKSDSILNLSFPENSSKVLFECELAEKLHKETAAENWLKIESRIKINTTGIWGCYLNSELISGDSVKFNKIRLDNAICKPGQANEYEFYVKIPPRYTESNFRLSLSAANKFEGEIQELSIEYLNNN